jgi:hypothetical protein
MIYDVQLEKKSLNNIMTGYWLHIMVPQKCNYKNKLHQLQVKYTIPKNT